jgi:hypothetical protein
MHLLTLSISAADYTTWNFFLDAVVYLSNGLWVKLVNIQTSK